MLNVQDSLNSYLPALKLLSAAILFIPENVLTVGHNHVTCTACLLAAVCDFPCLNGGRCMAPNTCLCDETYQGSNCSESKCSMLPTG